MASPHPLPTALKQARGNPGKRKLNTNEPKPSRELPPCPDWLTDGAKAAWAALVPELSRLGILTKIDVNAFTRYCINLDEWRTCVDFIKANGTDLVTRHPETQEVTGVLTYPHTGRKQKLEALLLKYEQEFGLTPSSRSKVHALPPQGEGDGMAQLLKGQMRLAK